MLKFFGKGSAFSSAVNSSAYKYNRDTKELLIIDCGENTFSKISNFIRTNGVKKVNVLITHTHADHVAGLSTLIYYMKYVIGSTLHIYVPTLDIENDINTILKIFGHGRWDGYDIKNFSITSTNMDGVKTIECNHLRNISEISVSCIKTEHTDDLKSYGYVLTYNGTKIYYSGDSCSLPKEIKIDLESFDVVYQDLTHLHYDGNVHMSLEVFKEEYPKKYWDKVIPYHISDYVVSISECKELGLDVLIDKF